MWVLFTLRLLFSHLANLLAAFTKILRENFAGLTLALMNDDDGFHLGVEGCPSHRTE